MEAAIVIGSIVAIIGAVFWLLMRSEHTGREKERAAANKRNLEAQERGRDAVSDARSDGRSNANRLRDNNSKW